MLHLLVCAPDGHTVRGWARLMPHLSPRFEAGTLALLGSSTLTARLLLFPHWELDSKGRSWGMNPSCLLWAGDLTSSTTTRALRGVSICV